MSRDLAAEHQADLVAKELGDLRALRDAVQSTGRLIARSNRYEKLAEAEAAQLTIYFDRDGMGPFTSLTGEAIFALVRLANAAKCSEVSP